MNKERERPQYLLIVALVDSQDNDVPTMHLLQQDELPEGVSSRQHADVIRFVQRKLHVSAEQLLSVKLVMSHSPIFTFSAAQNPPRFIPDVALLKKER